MSVNIPSSPPFSVLMSIDFVGYHLETTIVSSFQGRIPESKQRPPPPQDILHIIYVIINEAPRRFLRLPWRQRDRDAFCLHMSKNRLSTHTHLLTCARSCQRWIGIYHTESSKYHNLNVANHHTMFTRLF
jgi:hypothetical protein